jgi:hypothetical protein
MGSAVLDDPRVAGPGEKKLTDWNWLWSLARIEFGLSDDEFWSLHPLQLYHLMLRFEERCRRECGLGPAEADEAPAPSAGSIVDKVLAMKAQMGK